VTAAAVTTPVRPALRRRTEQRLVAGVAGGVADWLNAPVGFVRVGLWLGLWFSSWGVLVAYALAALLLPARGRAWPGWDNLVGLGRLCLLLVATPVLIGREIGPNGLLDQSPNVWIPLFGLALLGAGVLLTADYRRGRARSDAEARATALGAVPLVACGGAVGLGMLLVPDVRWDRVLPLCLVVPGVALIVGAQLGRWRPFVAPAVLATVLVGVLVASDARLQGGVGDLRLAPANVAELPPVVRRAVGDVVVDLTQVRPSKQPIVLHASVGVGSIRVIVPRGSRVVVDAKVGRGRISSSDSAGSARFETGFGLDMVHRWPPFHRYNRPSRRAVTLHVVARAGDGEVDVRVGL
jgi:phage shock protein PspC (stress-responsive transcriptional regulator)